MSASSDDPRFSQDLSKYLSADPNALPIPQRGSLGDINRGVLKTQPAVNAAYDKLRQQEDLASLQKQRINEQIGLGESLSSEALARGQTSAIQERKKAEDAANKYIDQVRANFPHEEFHPTKDNTQTLAGLFSLIGVIGMSMGGQGRLSAIGAKNAMSGMMNGWQTGNINRWNQEKSEYDRHMANIKNIVDDAYKDAQRMMQTASTNYQEAVAMAQQTAAKLGSQVARWKAANGSVEDFFKYVEGVKKDVDKADNQLFEEKKAKNRQDFEMSQQGRLFKHQEQMKKAEAPLGPNAFFEQTIGKRFANDNVAAKAQQAVVSLVSMDRLLRTTLDPQIVTGLASYLTNIKEKIKSLDDRKEILPEDVDNLINGAVNPTDKNAAFLKQALYTAFEAERAAQGGRLTVQMMKLGGSALNPQNYTKQGYLSVLGDRRNAIVANLRTNGLNDDQINTITKVVDKQQVPVNEPTSQKFTVEAPDGSKHEFNTEAEANKFRDLIKSTSGTGG